MAFCEKLEEYLKKEGFCPEKTDFGLQFKYETLDFIHFRDDQDENFLNLFFPQIFELGDVVPRALNMMIYYRDAFYQAYAATPTGKAELERMQAQQGK